MTYATTDLSDAHPEAPVCQPIFSDFGGADRFFGQIATLKVFEDNVEVRAALEAPGNGRVLVVDGGGSERCALLGGNLGMLAEKNNWAGVVVYGYVRDMAELAECNIGVKALGTHPRKSEKGLHSAQKNKPVEFAGVKFVPGAWVYGDEDGLMVSDTAIHQEK